MRGLKSLSQFALDAGIQGPFTLKQFIKVFDELSLESRPQGRIIITTENKKLQKSGILRIPKDFFIELAMVASECPINTILGIQILHPTEIGSHGYILTLQEYEQKTINQFKEKHSSNYEFELIMKQIESKEKFGEKIPEHIRQQLKQIPIEKRIIWPKGYEVNKEYFRIFVYKKHLTPKDFMEQGHSPIIASALSNIREPEPDWANIASDMLTTTKKILTPDNIYFDESDSLNLISTTQRDENKTTFDTNSVNNERTELYDNIKQALKDGKHKEIKSMDERISLIMKDFGYSYDSSDDIVRHYSYILASEKAINRNRLKKTKID